MRTQRPPHLVLGDGAGEETVLFEVVRQEIDPTDLTVYEGVPSTTDARALIDCRNTIMRDRLLDAVTAAKKAGLLRPREVQRVLDAIGHNG